ncbi:MAG: uroporphyrinogen-III C-methyltransferase [Oscillospiraceae bacterium]|jgi:uroporphyrinogen III methyltransferase/synthase
MKQGKVWLVGAGPGDAGLLTLKGKAVLEQADVVVYDRLVGEGVLRMIPDRARKIDVGKASGNHKVPQERINQRLLEEALAGNVVVRLKGGDPFLFGRGGEELELLCEHGVPFEIVPGVPSATAVPAYAGIPVTHRDVSGSLHIITAHRKQGSEERIDYKSLAALGDATLIFLMGISALLEICAGLMEAGFSPNTPAAVLERGTTAGQRHVISTLERLPEEAAHARIGTPGIIVVGKVCALAERFHWAEDRPLGGVRVLITRPREKASLLAEKLYDLGAEVVELPCIRTIPLVPCPELEQRRGRLAEYQWLIFSSAAGAEAFFDWMAEQRLDVRSLAGVRFAAVGEATKKAIEKRGILVDYTPPVYSGEALAAGLAERLAPMDRLLALVPEQTESAAAAGLCRRGFCCETASVYRTEVVLQKDFCPEPGDIAAFTSASAARGFCEAVLHAGSVVRAVCIGEKTAAEAKKYGLSAVCAKQATLDSIVDEILEMVQEERQ